MWRKRMLPSRNKITVSWNHYSTSTLQLPKALQLRTKSTPLAQTYNPSQVEQNWQEHWQDIIKYESNTRASSQTKDKKFRMILPPPNVTGALHLGHALTVTIQDCLARWHFMRGYHVEWVPGLDHAGIATQSVVERYLQKEKKVSRLDLGRDAFIKEVWEWNKRYGQKIYEQLDQLGTILNKDLSYFTLDEQRSKAVIDSFLRLHRKGLIYRQRRMVNWCSTLQSAISDIEIDLEQLEGPTFKTIPGCDKPVEFGVMHRIRYQIENSMEYLEVDTTRPETIFGDVAVAIHPDDLRYKSFHNKNVLHPFSQKPLPILLDATLVDMELGTGVVKVTPAHDANDFACGLRHGLISESTNNHDLEVRVIDDAGRICIPSHGNDGCVPTEFVGLHRFVAREKILEILKQKGLYVEKLPHATSLSLCSRSGDVIEPFLMPQWYVDCKEMAKSAADAVRNNRVDEANEKSMILEPSSHKHQWYYFLDNIQPWCVSRQLWWGHRIPAYRLKSLARTIVDDEKSWVIARTKEEAKKILEDKYNKKVDIEEIEQDADVLDTWFSSGLLPLSAFGSPNESDLQCGWRETIPLDVMETGSDILFFWVARMAMLCEELSGQLPFKKILLHPMVRDKAGRKMSKSVGNVIDPLHVIKGISLNELLDQVMHGNVGASEMKKAIREIKREFPKGIPVCGADALRFTLASYLQQGRKINMDVQRVIANRHFCNKIWNAVRYAIPLLEGLEDINDTKPAYFGLADRWILSRLARTVVDCNENLSTNNLAGCVLGIQKFFVQDLCDVYIEFSKPILYGNRLGNANMKYDSIAKEAAQVALYNSIEVTMRLLHPFSPFLSEELWQRVSKTGCASILQATYPEAKHVQNWVDVEAERDMQIVIDVIHGIRSLKHSIQKISPSQNESSNIKQSLNIRIYNEDLNTANVLRNAVYDIETQIKDKITIHNDSSHESLGSVLTHTVNPTCKVVIPVQLDQQTRDLVNSEVKRLQNRYNKVQIDKNRLDVQRSKQTYQDKVPQDIQQMDADRLIQMQAEMMDLMKSINVLQVLQHQD